MQDDRAKAREEATEAASQPSIGESLRSAREASQLSREAAAAALHLDADMLQALEADEYHRLGAAVFVRGHLRRYAALVSLDADALLLRYQGSAPAERLPSRPAGAGERFAVDDGVNWRLALGIVVLLLLVALAVWRLWGPSAEPITVATDLSQFYDADMAEPAATRQVLQMLSLPDFSSPQDASAAAAPTAPPGTAAGIDFTRTSRPISPDVPTEAGGLPLALSFSGECWTQITDATGRRLFAGLAQPGQRIAVRGAAPIALVLGNARAAELEVDGRAYAISGDAIVNNVARLVVEAPR